MRKMCLSIFALVIVFAMIIPAPIVYASPTPQGHTMAISGVVLTPDGQPVANLHVNFNVNNTISVTVFTDASGRYWNSVPSFARVTIAPSGGYFFSPTSYLIESVTRDMLTMDFTARVPRTLNGTVTSVEPLCATGGTVTVSLPEDPLLPIASDTIMEPDNTFSIGSLDYRVYHVTYTKPGCMSWNGEVDLTDENISLTIPVASLAYTASGRVLYPDGSGVANTQILYDLNTVSHLIDTDVQGRYSIVDLVPGDLLVIRLGSILLGYQESPAEYSITMEASNVSGLDFTSVGIKTASGTITKAVPATRDRCIADVPIRVEPSNPLLAQFTVYTTTGGNFSLTGLEPIIYALYPEKNGCTFNPLSGLLVDPITPEAQSIQFSANDKPYTVSGQVTRMSPGAAVTVRAVGTDMDGNPINITTPAAANGTYSFSGSFRWHDDIRLYFESSMFSFTPASINLGITETDRTQQNSSATLNSYSVAGTITHALTGAPLPGVTLHFNANTTISDSAGHYLFANVPHGTMDTISPSLTGYIFLPANRALTVTTNVAVNNPEGAFQAVPYGSLSGRITHQGHGLAGVTLTFGASTTTTAADGSYTFLSVAPGAEGDIVPALAGYIFTPAMLHVTMPPVAGSTAPNLSSQDFTTTQLLSIHGRVVAKDGVTPLPGVTFQLGAFSAVSDDTGNYTITGIPEGTSADLIPTLANYRFVPEKTNLRLTKDQTLATATQGIRQLHISGRVTNGIDGSEGVKISLGEVSTLTNASGLFDMVVDEGTSGSLKASKSGYHFLPAAITITSLNADLPDQMFVIAPNQYTLSGKVTILGKPLAGVELTLTGSDSSSVVVTSNAHGSYTFSGAVYGVTYTIVPNAPGYSIFPSQYVFPVKPENQKLNFSAFVYRRSIFGNVFLPDGVERIRVYYGSSYVYTNSDGSFTIPYQPANKLVVVRAVSDHYVFLPESITFPPGNVPLIGVGFSGTPSSVLSGRVTVTGKPVVGATIQVAWLTTKTDARGNYRMQVPKVLAGMAVQVISNYFLFDPQFVSTETNATLNFTNAIGVLLSGTVLDAGGIPVLSGVVRVSETQSTAVSPTGEYQMLVRAIEGINLWDFRASVESLPGYHAQPSSYQITPKNGSTNKNFTIRQNAWSASGKVTYNGRPLAGVKVTDTRSGRFATSDSNGVYRLTGLLFGNAVQLVASKSGYAFSAQPEFILGNAHVSDKNFTASK